MSSQETLFPVADHSNQGKDFEADLDAVHDWYRRQGWADVRKIPHAWQFISEREYLKLQSKPPPSHLAKTEDGRFMQRVKSDVDFTGGGFFRDFGFGIVFDAKSVKGDRFPLSNLESHQLHKLRERSRCKMLAGIMLRFKDYNRVIFVPYQYLNQRYEYWLRSKSGGRAAAGTASVSLADAEQNGVEIFRHKNNMLWDWLPCLVK